MGQTRAFSSLPSSSYESPGNVGDASHNYFTKLVKDNYLWQLVNFPTRNNNTLDLLLTNIPQKICNVHGFDDILKSDHKVISFDINLKVEKKARIKRRVYNFKKADWQGLKELLSKVPWEAGLLTNDVDTSLSNWCDMFLAAVDNSIPKCTSRNVNRHPWIDKELLTLIKKKNTLRKKAFKTGSQNDLDKFKDLRRDTKRMIAQKKKDHSYKMKVALGENPKRFWSYM
jgi:adenylate kinase family enzyme